MNPIDLKISHKTAYMDIYSMPDPLLWGLTIHWYNNSDGTLYMKIFGEGIGWSSGSVALGALTTGNNAYRALDNFMSRTRPTVATTETITLTLKGYSDAGYTTEMYSFSRTVTVIMIKSDDGTWTVDYSNNFDDGTVQGWTYNGTPPLWITGTLAVATDYKLSNPYSLKFTPNGSSPASHAYLMFYFNSVALLRLGYPTSPYNPVNKWVRVVIPLPSNTTAQVQIMSYNGYIGPYYENKTITTPNRTTIYAIFNVRIYYTTAGGSYFIVWLDDFKVISK